LGHQAFYPQPKDYLKTVVTAEVPGIQRVDGETIPRRNAKSKDKLVERPMEGIDTMHDILKYASATYGNARAMGTRKLIKIHHEVKKVKKMIDGKEQQVDKKWQYFELSGYEYMTFTEFERLSLRLGAGLRKLGLTAQDKVHMFAGTQ
jgi:long-chain acyl-CoA synthetase